MRGDEIREYLDEKLYLKQSYYLFLQIYIKSEENDYFRVLFNENYTQIERHKSIMREENSYTSLISYEGPEMLYTVEKISETTGN
jgi:hypothetical protein